jgi:large subunit ribosomal protein L28
MAKCDICNKSNLKGHKISITRSQVSRRSIRIFRANIKKVRVNFNGTVKKINVCTHCLRTNKIKRVV